MKISYNWLKSYLDLNLVPSDVAEILTNTGLEVESVEMWESVSGGLQGVVIGEIVACEKHPDADKLNVTKVDVGTGELLQIVCGAPNARVGLKSPVALVGTTLYPASGEKLQIKKAKIRGVESYGMICADDELGLGASHAGIMELDPATKAGTPAAEYFKVETDHVFEIGLTPNRSDAYSHIGVARDLAAALSTVYKIDATVQKPKTNLENAKITSLSSANQLDLCAPIPCVKLDRGTGVKEVLIEDTAACPRYSGVNIAGIKVADSPDWLKNKLLTIGLRPINNVVDITNYVLHEYGQPLHAFDADKLKGGKIIVKKLAEGTTFKALDGTDRKLSADDLMICDAAGPVCIAGVFGGLDSGVSDRTTNIFLESAHFDQISVRKTAARHNLRTDAAMHFEKITDINATVEVLKRAASLICEICGGHVVSDIIDVYSSPVKGYEVTTTITRLNKLAGADIPVATIKNILTKLGITIENEDGDNLSLLVPTFRADVKREADILEEILRIYGYNNIPMPKTLQSSLSFSPKVDQVKLDNIAAALLTGMGFCEISTNSITQSTFEQDAALKQQQILLLNSQTAELDSLRTSMLYTGLEVIAHNQNRKSSDLRLYEIGKTYHRDGNAFSQHQHLVLFLTGQDAADNWLTKGRKYDFYHLQSYVSNILTRFGVREYESKVVEATPFIFASYLSVEHQHLATYGQIDRIILKNFDIKQDVFFADINWDLVMQHSQHVHIQYRHLPKFPAVRRDLAMLVSADLRFEQIEHLARAEGRKLLREVSLFDVYKGDKIEAGKKSYAVSFTFLDPEKTLTDADIDKTMGKLMKKLESELGAVIRK
ncbi:MAG: phenylalanine--tRNA ligase subunit beta [Bacteroidetes bacterium]|nr:phenylalanine--tRNA ligase subunit beta [Bacteroidota bacterium]